MRDIRIKPGAPDHPKTERLCRRLGDGAWRCLNRLWLFAAEAHPTGDLSSLDDEAIEIAAGWRGDAGVFVRALREVRYLDGSVLHDWEEHEPWIATAAVRSAQAREAAKRRWAQRAGVPPSSPVQEQGMPTAVRYASAPLCGTDAERNALFSSSPSSPLPSPSGVEDPTPTGDSSPAAGPAVDQVLRDVAPGTLASGPTQDEIRRRDVAAPPAPDCGTCPIRLSKTTGECLGAAWATRRRHSAGQVVPGDRACRTLRSVVQQHPSKLGNILDESQAAMEQDAHDQALVDELDRRAADEAQAAAEGSQGPAHEAQSGSQEARTTKRKPAVHSGDHPAFIAAFTERFKACTGGASPTWDAKSAKWVKGMLAKHTLAELRRRLANFEAAHRSGAFGADKFTLGAFVVHIDRWAAGAATPAPLGPTGRPLPPTVSSDGRDLIGLDWAGPCPRCQQVGVIACNCGLLLEAKSAQDAREPIGGAS